MDVNTRVLIYGLLMVVAFIVALKLIVGSTKDLRTMTLLAGGLLILLGLGISYLYVMMNPNANFWKVFLVIIAITLLTQILMYQL